LEARAKISKNAMENLLSAQGTLEQFAAGDGAKSYPEWDKDRCIKCGICYVYCPDGAISREEDGYFDVNKDRCRGCGICHRECWFGVISMVEEE